MLLLLLLCWTRLQLAAVTLVDCMGLRGIVEDIDMEIMIQVSCLRITKQVACIFKGAGGGGLMAPSVIVLCRCGCTTALSTTSRLKATRSILCLLSVLTRAFPTPSGVRTTTRTSASSPAPPYGAERPCSNEDKMHTACSACPCAAHHTHKQQLGAARASFFK